MELEFEEIYPKIRVYKNMWKDIENLTNIVIESEKNPEGSAFYGSGQETSSGWKQWYTFGKEADMFNYQINETDRVAQERKCIEEINDVFFKVTEHYALEYNVPIEKEKMFFDETLQQSTELWRKIGPSICKYDTQSGLDDPVFDLAMHMHTDYQKELEHNRGYKFTLTCTMYLNDDYDGGGLDFLVGDNILFLYKPKAGDVIVFPAGDPNYLSDPGELYRHGVRKCYNNPKYFIRNNWSRYYPGSKEWLDQEAIYGQESWAQMELERVKEGRRNGMYQPLDYQKIYSEAKRIR
jgi:hypothetical protein